MDNFKFYNHLGFHNPYYTKKDGKIILADENAEALLSTNQKTLDFTAVVQILSTGYSFGDRTLVKEIKKSPWMARPNKDDTNWNFFDLPKHDEQSISEEESSVHFYQLLTDELIHYVKDHNHIGILLTGGMDSRIVASVLNNVIIGGKLKNKKVTAYTWGSLESRDVVYAKKIAKLFSWEWKHVIVDSAQVLQNFNLTIENGCEYTPIHLHAMSKVAEESGLDCVLAGSFGDSIGRGEYSGTKVKQLTNLDSKIKNLGGILRRDYFSMIDKEFKDDLNFYHKKFPEKFDYQQIEQDLQLHYMRRMLNSCMNVINKKIPLYQMFSSPSVFGYIWSIDPEFRTDLIYKKILEKYSPILLEIPWARTGLIYPEKEGVADKFKKSHHNYGDMIRSNFFQLIEDKLNENNKVANTIFNVNNIKKLISNCRSYPMPGSFLYEEKLLWIASLLEYIRINNITIELPEKEKNSYVDYIKEDLKYKLKYFYKKIL